MERADQVTYVCAHLDSLGISYELHEHPAVYTVAEGREVWHAIPGGHAKNLFLRDKKGKRHILMVLEHGTAFDIKAFGDNSGIGKLSFASAGRLDRFLGVEPGSVTPFGLINDTEGRVEVCVDESLIAHDCVNFHPNVNTATVTVSSRDFVRFLEASGNPFAVVSF